MCFQSHAAQKHKSINQHKLAFMPSTKPAGGKEHKRINPFRVYALCYAPGSRPFAGAV